MKEKKLFDYECVVKNRKRFDPNNTSSLFFHNQVIEEVGERIAEINDNPSNFAIVTGFSELWRKSYPDADVISDSKNLRFPLDKYDLILHSLSLHWSNDPVGQLIQCQKSCKSGGMVLAVLFGGQTLIELRTALITGETRLKSGASPRIAPMGEIMDLGNLMTRTNFKNPISDRMEFILEYNSLNELMLHLRKMGEANPLTNRRKNFTGRRIFQEAEKYYREKFSLPSGKIYATFELIFLTGWKPESTYNQFT